jgi:hypothetical protein
MFIGLAHMEETIRISEGFGHKILAQTWTQLVNPPLWTSLAYDLLFKVSFVGGGGRELVVKYVENSSSTAKFLLITASWI